MFNLGNYITSYALTAIMFHGFNYRNSRRVESFAA